MDTLTNFKWSNLFNNLYYMLTRNLTSDMQQNGLRQEILYLQAISLAAPWADLFAHEIKFLREEGFSALPYPQIRSLAFVESGQCTSTGLPFVVHSGKRLYFPKSYSLQKVEGVYRRYIERECLLGGGFTEKAPHQYETDTFHVRSGDVVVDAGAAEGLFALDMLEKAHRIYVVECDPLWHQALRATFAPYADKVELIERRLAQHDTRQSIRLDTLLKHDCAAGFFVKMDIEGAEVPVVEASQPFLTREQSVRLCCCAYHRQDDAQRLESFFHRIGYKTKRSEGYILYSSDARQRSPYFRPGLVRAWRQVT